MAIPLKLLQGDLIFQAEFSEPAFGLFRETASLYGALLSRLSRYGLTLADMKFEGGGGTLAEANVLCNLLNLTTLVRVRLDRIEVHYFDIKRIPGTQAEGIAFASVEAPQAHTPGISYRTFSVALAVHGLLDGISSREFLSRFSTSSSFDRIGPPTGSGAVFYFGAQGEQIAASVTVDLSAVIQQGLFARTHVVWDAAKVTIDRLSGLASTHIQTVFDQLGIAVKQGD